MDLQFWWMLFKVILSLLFIVLLIYIFAKYGGQKFKSIQGSRYINILERTQLSKENSLFVIKIGEKGYVISSSNGKVEIICELPEKELSKVESMKNVYEYKNLGDLYRKTGLQDLVNKVGRSISAKKLKVKKEDRDER
ncbi:flagellar biosynthetic protein FliO [Clostridium sp. HV4-5-A1G]|uniref:flagellar biosynthetic protein FliO n=1 Tax=Clostridium sp. HV4-5-A1G TaxID=2004595 RepID=UPI00123A7646|nr:flagellar biosynthetic protein FliO [Clostridium sp. HV4-5-A1G]KAA8675194.1 flagellar biosynthetic protein FliO [Clostridium sp. HV4-5-A1G]